MCVCVHRVGAGDNREDREMAENSAWMCVRKFSAVDCEEWLIFDTIRQQKSMLHFSVMFAFAQEYGVYAVFFRRLLKDFKTEELFITIVTFFQ